MGDTLGLAGPGSYRKYEVGTVVPPVRAVQMLADYFDVSLDYLIGASDAPTPAPAIFREPLRHVLHERIDELCAKATTAQQAALLARLEEWEKTL